MQCNIWVGFLDRSSTYLHSCHSSFNTGFSLSTPRPLLAVQNPGLPPSLASTLSLEYEVKVLYSYPSSLTCPFNNVVARGDWFVVPLNHTSGDAKREKASSLPLPRCALQVTTSKQTMLFPALRECNPIAHSQEDKWGVKKQQLWAVTLQQRWAKLHW